MDASSATRGAMIAGASGIVLFVVMFISWFGNDGSIDTGIEAVGEVQLGFATSFNAWEAFDFIDLVLLLAVICAVGYGLIGLSGASVTLPAPASAITALVGAIAFLLVLYRVIDPPGESLDRELGVWLGLIATAGITYGGYRGMQEEGTSFGEDRG